MRYTQQILEVLTFCGFIQPRVGITICNKLSHNGQLEFVATHVSIRHHTTLITYTWNATGRNVMCVQACMCKIILYSFKNFWMK